MPCKRLAVALVLDAAIKKSICPQNGKNVPQTDKFAKLFQEVEKTENKCDNFTVFTCLFYFVLVFFVVVVWKQQNSAVRCQKLGAN